MPDRSARLARALEWIARLPLCGDHELAQLLGVDKHDAHRLVGALSARGWVETVPAASPELDARRLALLRAEAAPALAAACGRDPAALARAAPVRPRDIAGRVARLEAYASVNRLLADLAEGLESSGVARLADARSLPLALPRDDRWWLPGVEGYGCLRSGALHAPFLVAWDRAAAPDAHRRGRLGGWLAASDRAGRRWGPAGLPPVLVIAPSDREARVWEGAVARRDRAGSGRIDVLLTTREELEAAGTADARWWRPGRAPAELVEQLGWGGAPAVDGVRIERALGECAAPGGRGGTAAVPWKTRLVRHVAGRAGGSTRERIAAVTLGTDADEKLLMEWVALHPLLDAVQLATLLDRPAATVERRVGRLQRQGLLEGITYGRDGNHPGARGLVLSGLGLRFLAARDGVPPHLYAQHGALSATGDGNATAGVRLDGLMRHLAHSLGVNRTLVRLAVDARRSGHHVAEWRNEAESACRIGHGRYWIRPDAAGVVRCSRAGHAFLLEYDRGTLSASDYRRKLAGYHRYYESGVFEDDFATRPVVLVVATDDRAEEHFARAAQRAAREFASPIPLILTAEWRLGGGPSNRAGLLGPVWRTSSGSAERRPWPLESAARKAHARVAPDRRCVGVARCGR